MGEAGRAGPSSAVRLRARVSLEEPGLVSAARLRPLPSNHVCIQLASGQLGSTHLMVSHMRSRLKTDIITLCDPVCSIIFSIASNPTALPSTSVVSVLYQEVDVK